LLRVSTGTGLFFAPAKGLSSGQQDSLEATTPSKGEEIRMSKFIGWSALVLLAVAVYAVLPAAIVWGWVRWFKRSQPRTVFSTLSLIGFALATASALLAVSALLFSFAIGGFAYYNPALLRIYGIGILLSLAGIVFASIGVWRPSSLRWHALACAFGALIFWLIAVAGE
jgi:hypothetical protein